MIASSNRTAILWIQKDGRNIKAVVDHLPSSLAVFAPLLRRNSISSFLLTRRDADPLDPPDNREGSNQALIHQAYAMRFTSAPAFANKSDYVFKSLLGRNH